MLPRSPGSSLGVAMAATDTLATRAAPWNGFADGRWQDQQRARAGVLDVDAVVDDRAGSGYIDREREPIVGLQPDAPLKRAILPNGGWRMVESRLCVYGFDPDPRLREIFTR
jgi:pyruvate-formate lyase